MDDIDNAQINMDAEMERRIAAVRNKPLLVPANGCCLFCGNTVKEGVRWCSLECRDDWELRNE